MINAGTAGGFRSKGAAIGDVFVSTRLRNHDRRLNLPVFCEYGIHLHEALPTPNLQKVSEREHAASLDGGRDYDCIYW